MTPIPDYHDKSVYRTRDFLSSCPPYPKRVPARGWLAALVVGVAIIVAYGWAR